MSSDRRSRWIVALALAGLFLSTASVLPLLTGSAGTAGTATLLHGSASDPVARKLWYAVYAAVLVLLARDAGRLTAIIARQKALTALIALTLASTAWSGAPSLTLQRGIALVLTTGFALVLATRFTPREILTLLAIVLAAVAAVSLLLVVFAPALGLDPDHGGAWRGAFTTKNELGRMMTFSALVWLLRFWHGHGRRAVSLAFTLLSLLMVAGSGSRTSLAALLALGAFLVLAGLARAHDGIALPTLTLASLGASLTCVWALTHTGTIAGFFGASSNLTGRTKIWAAAWAMAKDHPWLGYGYEAFWRGLDGPSARVWAVVQSTPPHAHNGFLDLWLDLGAVGVGLFALTLLTSLRLAFVRLRTERDDVAVFFLAMLGFLAFFNITESNLLSRNSIFWIAFVVVAVQLRESTQRAPQRHVATVRPHAVPVGVRP